MALADRVFPADRVRTLTGATKPIFCQKIQNIVIKNCTMGPGGGRRGVARPDTPQVYTKFS